MATLQHITLQPLYAGIVFLMAWFTLSLAIFIPNRMFVWFGLTHGGDAFDGQLAFLMSFYGSLLTNFTPLAAVSTVAISLLFGLNVALLVFYVRMMRGNGTTIRVVGSLSIGGLVSDFFGIGCAVCGSVILTSLLGLVGASSLLLFLPRGGEEFLFLAFGLLSYGLFVLIKKIDAGRLCMI